ncbi:nitroreductase family protein [Bifidobacterium xylocopae]|nr:nitroreductase family protein [Bifidobacterium xylocopae]
MACSSDISKIYEQYPDGRTFSFDDETTDSPGAYAEKYREIIHDAGQGLTQGVIEVGGTEMITIRGVHQPAADMILDKGESTTTPILSPSVYMRQVTAQQYSLESLTSPTTLYLQSDILPWVLSLKEAPKYFSNLLWRLNFIEDKDTVSHAILPFEDELSLKYARFGSHKNGYGGTYYLAEEHPELLQESLNPVVPCENTLKLPLSRIHEISLSDAMHNRRSSRDHSTPPAALEDILTLLSLSAQGNPSGTGVRNEPLYRFPYPSGGSLGELRFLVITNRVTLNGDELGKNCFEYQPLSNTTYKHRVGEKALSKLIKLYSNMPGIPPEELQCLIIVLADAAKVAAKYESVAPALIYKHVGAWMQTAYLTALQLPLSVCSLGGGPTDVMQRLFWFEDSPLVPVGEMVCARRTDNVSNSGHNL